MVNNCKICSKCKINKNADMYGIIKKKLKSGELKIHLKSQCKECEIESQRIRRNKEKENNPEEYHKKWADYYAKTKEHNKQSQKNWLANPINKEKRNEYIRNYKANKRLNDPSYKIYENYRKRLWKCLKNKSNSSKELLGCDINMYLKWISFTMLKDNKMTWENYGTYWNIDHVKPISSFNMQNREEIKKAFNWKNTWAMTSSENFSKCNKIINEQIIIHNKLLEQYIKENNLIDL